MATPLPSDQFNEIARLVCPHCRSGHALRLRADTGEWVHDVTKGAVFSHSICWADGLRRSGYAPKS